MNKQLVALGIIGLLVTIGISGCLEDNKNANNGVINKFETIKISIFVEKYFYEGANVSNESLIVEVKEGDYFGVPSLSGFAYIDNGSLMFEVIEIIDDEHAKVQFNESMLYNFSDVTGTRVYYDNPLIFDTNITRFTTRPLTEWLIIDPYPIVDIYLKIIK